MASIKDVAKYAGVSISTVSNVINGTKAVSPELTKKIRDAVEKLEYQVDPVARSLKNKKTMTIGVLITNINRIFFPQVIKGIQETAEKHGYNITLGDSNDQTQKEKRFIEMMESNWVDGIILDSAVDFEDTEYFKYLSRLGNEKKRIPVVSLERKIDVDGIGSIVADNCYGGSMAANHLIEKGCRKIACISGPLYSGMAKDRLKGYKDALLKNNLEFTDERVVEGDFSPLSGYEAMKKMIMNGIEIDGVFASNDQMAIGAIKAIKEYGFKIPEQVKVVGFDNTFVASIVDPSLTTIHVPKYRMGVEAVTLLVKKIKGHEKASLCVELPINLIVRQSTSLRGQSNWELYGW